MALGLAGASLETEAPSMVCAMLGKRHCSYPAAWEQKPVLERAVEDDLDDALATDCGMVVIPDYLLRSRRKLFRACSFIELSSCGYGFSTEMMGFFFFQGIFRP